MQLKNVSVKYAAMVSTFATVVIALSYSFLPREARAASKNLRLAWDAAPRTIDPRYAVDANSQYLEDLTNCALVSFDADGKTVLYLASKYDWKSPTELRVQIKADAKFSDGKGVTASDVRATYLYFLDKAAATPSPRAGAFANVTKVDAPDTHSVVFTLAKPEASFLTNLVVGIMPANLTTSEMITDPAKLVGCGPFKVANSDFNSVMLVRNPNFSLAPAPSLEGIEIKIVKDEQTRLVKLEKGELDLVQNLLSRDKLKDLSQKSKNLSISRRAGLNVTYLGFNMQDKIAGNLAVRQAISHAIDRDAIIKHLLGGYAIPATTILPPSDLFLNKEIVAPTLDLKLSEKILDDAGLKDPDGDGPKERFEIEYKTTTDQTRVSIAKAIASQLKKIGIKVNVSSMDWGKFKADVEAGRVQMWSLSWIGFKDPDIYRFAFGSTNFPPAGPNRGYYKNEKLDLLLDQGVAQTDVTKRQATYKDVQRIVANELPYVFLWHEEAFAVTSKAVQGFQLFADGRLSSLTNASLAQ